MSQSYRVSHNDNLQPNLKEQFLQQLKQEVSLKVSELSKPRTNSAADIKPRGNIGLIKRVSKCAVCGLLWHVRYSYYLHCCFR